MIGALILTAQVAMIFAVKEGREFAENFTGFIHKKEWKKKAAWCAAVFVLIGGAHYLDGNLGWNYAFAIPGMWAAFTLTHRTFLNWWRHPRVKFHYMGPHIRGPKEAEYDTFWWERAATDKKVTMKFQQGQQTWSVHYTVPRKWLPWLYCTLFELSILALSSWGYFHFTNN